ncbi:DUF2271 domain-containing protein [Meiothermus granaticius]|uniref:DUF2271 domain-containing protein n=1 Tax=Meiothermus granaticius NBRC 107808 TaxID=1227551 RepID=A0A399FA63_9DEIN|nr:DUF2271 domain-containing protein [Meiothermus granaticius]RIH92596.1 hypothetical protein Mgrana_01496 [Meiothermus granaticius NBRC 107808]GEM87986.1 hypothetical protein MGR01S_26110 [Meiothermus granaticius NBRC 107808]
MKQTRISRRAFIYRVSGLALTLWAGRSLAQAPKLPAGMKLDISFEIVAPPGGRYRPPYVAVWIENAQGLPVRQLALWFEESRPRYLRELVRWAGENTSIPVAVSGPTRFPGRYTLSWDLKDEKGNTVGQGDYYVCIEMAREHGPYELFREKLSLGTAPLSKTYPEDGELKGVTLTYGK